MGMQSLLADPLSSLGPVFCHMQDRQERGGGEGEADPNCSQKQKEGHSKSKPETYANYRDKLTQQLSNNIDHTEK